ncbi:neutral amino acid permease [Colletotrichum kahawae]|uniref:Neutral amino acid permease n=1 Tax=Colletotrichum kahawae TaxID=34407 RepID=A0AAD9YFX6_COLKA|nr:neutral amino acid permease [Colletotrichum kahawae]
MAVVVANAKVAVVATTPVDQSDDEVTQIWQEVQAMVIRMAGGDPNKIDKQLDIDGVLRHLGQVQAKDQKAAEKHAAVKDTFSKTLQVISKVGGLVADGVSNAFGPANQCFNALNFVIVAWQSYSEAFESLAALLEKCAEFFERFTYYTNRDASLRKVICCQFRLFIRVCDKSLQLGKKRHKIKMFFSRMFLDDDDIKGLLSEMENLNAREHGLVSAQTFRISQDAAKASQEAAKTSKDSSMKLDTLVEQNTANKKEKTEQKGEDLRKYGGSRIEGTGKWLDTDPLFTAWMTGDDTTDPILGIEGPKGSGKTLVVTHIIDRLQKQRTVGGSGTRSAVAHYFLEADAKEDATAGFRRKHVIACRASKSLLWQLAQEETPFLKSIAGLCDADKVDLDDPVDIWRKFLLENEDRSTIESTFFIVLDGLGENLDALTNLFRMLSDDQPRLRTRVLITGTSSTFEQIEKEDKIRIKKLRLETRNSEDIKIYIEARMNHMEILSDITRPGVTDVRKRVLEALENSTNGDYTIAIAALDNIERVDSLEEVEDCLEKAGGARSIQVLEDIQRFNQIMKPKEIEEINEIILWVKWGLRWMTSSQIEAALELKADRDTDGRQTSLRSLQSKIEKKYNELFYADSEGLIDFKRPEMWDNIPQHNNADPILPEELNIVQHYLSTVCPKNVYDKFGFKEFFERRIERKENSICQDPDNAELKLALRCLRCLIEEQTDKSKLLRSYAAECLYQHLDSTNLSLADRKLKAEAGTLLVRLFTEETAIDALLSRDYGRDWENEGAIDAKTLPSNWEPWVFSDLGNTLLRKWSQDSSVLEHLDNKKILENIINREKGDQYWYEKAAMIAARRLLKPEDRGRELTDAFALLYGLIKRMNHKSEGEQDEFKVDDNQLWFPTLEHVSAVETWARDKLGFAENDALWQTQMVKLLYYLSNDTTITNKDVVDRARQTIKLYPDDWMSSFFLARILTSSEEAAESIEILERVKEQLKGVKDDPVWRSTARNLKNYADIIETLGDRYWSMDNDESTEKAVSLYFMAVEEDHPWPVFYAQLIVFYFGNRGLWTEIVEYCDKLLKIPDEDVTVGAKVAFLGSKNHGRLFWDTIRQACDETDRWDLLQTMWEAGDKRVKTTLYQSSLKAKMNAWHRICMARRPGYKNAGIGVIEGMLTEDWVRDQDADVLNELTLFILPIYTRRAFKPDSTPEAINAALKKALDLHEIFKKGQTSCEWMPSLRFARFFHLKGDDIPGKRLLSQGVARMIEMLSDDDVENDWYSFSVLAQVFAAFGETANMIACWEMMTVSRIAEVAEYERKLALYEATIKDEATVVRNPEGDASAAVEIQGASAQESSGVEAPVTTEEPVKVPEDKDEDHSEKAQPTSLNNPVDVDGQEHPENAKEDVEEEKSANGDSEKTPVAKPEEPSRSIGACHGYCDVTTTIPNGIWYCMECCGQVWLHEGCYTKAGAKAVRDLMCSKDHTFIPLPPCDEATIKAIPAGFIRVDGKHVKMEQWKAEVKANYVDCVEAETPDGSEAAE